MVLRLLVGSQWGWPDSTILGLRLLRVELALVAGVALATSGVGLQSLLRNPLAEPFILGLSSGAAVGVIVQLFMRRILELNVGPSQYGAMIGAMATLGMV